MNLCADCGKPRLLDTFCCQGGATCGYQAAGFCVTGVDIDPQPRYCGDQFHQGDAVQFVRDNLEYIRESYTALAASPPCQRYSKAQRIQNREHPDLISGIREAFLETGLPYVIENVEDAREELKDPVLLCGPMFGLSTYRHRLFEASFKLVPPLHLAHVQRTVKMGRPLKDGEFYHAVGNFSNVPYVRRDMGMEWASREGLREAVPPAYAEYIGAELFEHLLSTSSQDRPA